MIIAQTLWYGVFMTTGRSLDVICDGGMNYTCTKYHFIPTTQQLTNNNLFITQIRYTYDWPYDDHPYLELTDLHPMTSDPYCTEVRIGGNP